MIIDYPTGLYKNVLPQEPGDDQNVTYLISNNPPPRDNLFFPKMSVGVASHRRPPHKITPQQRRLAAGPLVFTVSRSAGDEPGSGARQYDIGEVLEFGEPIIRTVDQMLVSDKTEVQHNLNVYDYAQLGLTEQDVQLINEQSLEVFDGISDTLNHLRARRADAEARIHTAQKTVNEAEKNIQALEVMARASHSTQSDIMQVLNKLRERRAAAQAVLNGATEEANEAASQAQEELRKLRTVGMVLK